MSGSLINETSTAESDIKQDKKPLVFIIDELDRCRPDFALSLLERIKHFFSVPNVHFILGIHSGQLENSVRSFYGNGIDAHNYLQKFIHFSFNIRSDEDYRKVGLCERNYVAEIFRRHEFPKTDLLSAIIIFLSNLVSRDAVSLRAVERIASSCALVIAFGHDHRAFRGDIIKQEIAICLIIVRAIGGDLYIKAKDGKLNFEEFLSRLKITSPETVDNEDYFVALWRYLLTGHDHNEFDFAGRTDGEDRMDLIQECARRIVERTGR